MGAESDLAPSPTRLSAEVVDAGAQLLVIGTNKALLPDREGYAITAWPSCREATISRVSGYVDRGAPFENHTFGLSKVGGSGGAVGETSDELRVRQGKTAVRRFGRHNGLEEMITFTFAELPTLSLVPGHVKRFWEKWKVSTGCEIPPYVWVPEWGSETGRLHIHMGVSWWFDLGCVNVCEMCALPGLRKTGFEIPPAGSLCIGCLWGRGIVGWPESNGDGRALTKYLTKYIGKDLGKVQFDPQTGKPVDHRGFYKNRYHTSRGHKPAPVHLWAPDRLVTQFVCDELVGRGQGPVYESEPFEVRSGGTASKFQYLDYLSGGVTNV